MTYVPISLIPWDWLTDIRGILVGAVGGALAMRLWDSLTWRKDLVNRMSKIEGGFEKLDISLSGKITSLEGTLNGKLIALESLGQSLKSTQESHRSENQVQFNSLMRTLATLDELRGLPVQLSEGLAAHAVTCRDNVIRPIIERLTRLEVA